jgi:NAD(P)-dependent dehydrogenase (short-subunit alcohol dehydrogenase family)
MAILTDTAAVVTGAGQGIGLGIATALAKEGADVLVVERDEARLSAAVDSLSRLGVRAVPALCDVADGAAITSACELAAREFGHVGVLVNNAQAMVSGVPFEEHSDEDFDLALSTGLRGAFRFMRGCFPLMRERGGSIVNIVSSAGTHGLRGFAGYAAAKEGIRGLTKVAANEWGPYGIRVNAISPQANTPTTEAYFADHPERRTQKIAERPLRRDGDAERDIGRTVVFLAGPDSSFITGCTLMVNGGLTIMP